MTDHQGDSDDEAPTRPDHVDEDERSGRKDEADSGEVDESVEQVAEEAREEAAEEERKADIDHRSTEREADAQEQENPDGHRDEEPFQS